MIREEGPDIPHIRPRIRPPFRCIGVVSAQIFRLLAKHGTTHRCAWETAAAHSLALAAVETSSFIFFGHYPPWSLLSSQQTIWVGANRTGRPTCPTTAEACSRPPERRCRPGPGPTLASPAECHRLGHCLEVTCQQSRLVSSQLGEDATIAASEGCVTEMPLLASAVASHRSPAAMELDRRNAATGTLTGSALNLRSWSTRKGGQPQPEDEYRAQRVDISEADEISTR